MTNAPKLDPLASKALAPFTSELIHRNNFGLDFGAYKDGFLDIISHHSPKRLILCNDSVYGPFTPLAPVLDRATPDIADVWGMTDCYDLRYHLQSYFILYHEKALASEALLAFWREAPYVDSRGWLIHHGEIALTQSMLAQSDLRVRALFPLSDVRMHLRRMIAADAAVERKRRLPPYLRREHAFRIDVGSALDTGIPLNPTHFFWDILIAECGFPFIKRDLLQFNPVKIPNLATWREIIRDRFGFDTMSIERHLQERLRGRSI
jgi:lipopolysaccharide biosynthesis protein